MRIIIEQILIWSGIFGLMPSIGISYFNKSIPISVIEFFRGGNTGAIIEGGLWCLGIVGVLFFLLNLISGIHNYWLIRLCSFLLSFIAILSVAGRM